MAYPIGVSAISKEVSLHYLKMATDCEPKSKLVSSDPQGHCFKLLP